MIENIYRSLYLIRRVEEEIVKIYPTDKIKSPVHLAIGQEAVSVGVCQTLKPEDVVFGTYRSHALYLAKGGNLKRMVAEMYGKITGCSKGKGGSMHLIDTDANMMGTSSIVGSVIPNAVGYAYAARYQKKPIAVICFFGDGATDEGVFTESLNFAALKKLPVIFICENNKYAIHTHQLLRQPNDRICDRARAFDIPAERIEDNDVIQIYERVNSAIQSVRKQNAGPFFFECMTYRWKEHVGTGEDYHLGYRDSKEAEPWIQNDQLKRIADMLDSQTRKSIEEGIEQEILEAIEFAETSSFPEANELCTDIFKD
jgi:2-oxoisovalerate dehydrogenase E1 component